VVPRRRFPKKGGDEMAVGMRQEVDLADIHHHKKYVSHTYSPSTGASLEKTQGTRSLCYIIW
jgi:hypothetical protein